MLPFVFFSAGRSGKERSQWGNDILRKENMFLFKKKTKKPRETDRNRVRAPEKEKIEIEGDSEM
jgi:hypothetical protein